MRQHQMDVYDRGWLETARRVKGYTQAQVASAVGCSVAYYNRVEQGLHVPTVTIALKIADILDVDVRNFLTEKTIKSEA